MLIDYFEQLASAPTRETAPKTTDETRTTDGKQTGVMKREVRHICAELPTFEGFARSIGFSSPTLKDWEKAHPAFAESCARARDIQTQLMIDRGLNGQYAEGAFVFVAQNITRLRPATLLGGILDGVTSGVRVTIETVGAQLPAAEPRTYEGTAESGE